ncbi:MAG: hypothetical protein EXR98_03225 [Gemmataceae bacterium]|nr:hypothetical protein [Gemmataceae bacterium]
MVRTTRPIISKLMRQQVAQQVNETPEPRQEREAAEIAECERMLNTPTEDVLTGEEAPSPNGKKRPSPKRGEHCGPSTNGENRFATCPPHHE